MSLKEELKDMMASPDRILEVSSMLSFRTLSEEDQDALRCFFQDWAEPADEIPNISSGSLIALGFILGHNWVKEHWTLW